MTATMNADHDDDNNNNTNNETDALFENDGPLSVQPDVDSRLEKVETHFANGGGSSSGGGGSSSNNNNDCYYHDDDVHGKNNPSPRRTDNDYDHTSFSSNNQTETMCSILNVVIDHTMESITPLEDKEWRHYQQQQQQQQQQKTRQNQRQSSSLEVSNHPSSNTKNQTTLQATSLLEEQVLNLNNDAKNNNVVVDDDTNNKDNTKSPSPNELLQVPVIRIFGPLLRDPYQVPVQSACLYIHGAFPYLLARPVIAGPDGSLIRAGRYHNHHHHPSKEKEEETSSSSFVDWDDVADVEKIQIDIQRIVEETAQSLDFGGSGGAGADNNNNNNNITTLNRGNDNLTTKNSLGGSTNKIRHPIIRSVTVVEGRGFYSYCPGPSAPFLKVEYYDPKLRWKVKLVLERGLEVPLRYHPDPRQYDKEDDDDDIAGKNELHGGGHPHKNRYQNQHNQSTISIDDNLLKFHCYEAHIPYTMQFFKDHNLAGMSYIHLRKGRIRGRLTERYAPSIKQNRMPVDSNGEHDMEALNRSVFIRSNTPKKYLWSTYVKVDEGVGNSPEAQLTQSNSHPATHDEHPCDNFIAKSELDDGTIIRDDFTPPPKNTSCDVELDCTVHDIRNVEAVMTTMPTDPEERDKIQWRAVPSLQEIWREERRRMDRLLSPELTQHVMDDVLTPKVGKVLPLPLLNNQQQQQHHQHDRPPPPFTLNVKKGAPRSGGRLAVRGMWSLVAVTAGLQQDFVRSLSDILRRHRKAIEDIDDDLRRRSMTRMERKSSTTIINDGITPTKGVSRRKWQFSSPGTPSVGSVPSHGDKTSTPSIVDAIGALETLGFATPGTKEDDHFGGSQIDHTHDNVLSIDEAIVALESLAESFPGGITSQNDSIPGLSPPPSSEHTFHPTGGYIATPPSQSQVLSSQRLSQPLSYQSSQQLHDGIISMLQVDPVEFSQRIDRGDSVLEFQDRDIEDLIDPQTLAPYDHIDFDEGRCRAIFVVETDPPHKQRLCGLPWGSCTREGHFNAEERAKPGIYRTLTTGAVVDGLIDTSKGELDDEEGDNDVEEYCRSTQRDAGIMFDLATQPTQDWQVYGLVDRSLSQRLCELKEIEENSLSGEDDDEETTGNLSKGKMSLENAHDINPIDPTRISTESLQSNVEPPNRGLVSKLRDSSKRLAPSERHKIPDWLSHASAYERLKSSKSLAANAHPNHRKLQLSNLIIQPTIIAPSRKMVKSWTKRKSKVDFSVTFGPQNKKRKLAHAIEGKPGTNKKQVRQLLEIDSNSRKLVPNAGNVSTGIETDKVKQHQGIEEVVWESSQTCEMTPTQSSQIEMEDGEQNGRKGKLTRNMQVDESTPASVQRSEDSRSLTILSESQVDSVDPLIGIGNQGGRIHIEGGGGLKARTKLTQFSKGRLIGENEKSNDGERNTFLSCPISIMSVEIHVQCREGTSRLDSKKISMAQDSNKDRISAIVFVYARDPGGGESLDILSRGCICTTLDGENPNKDSRIDRDAQHQLLRSIPRSTMGVPSQLVVEVVEDERHLLRRFKDIVRLKDPDMLISWDTQGAGLGYMIERGIALGNSNRSGAITAIESGTVDMAKLLGRTPTDMKATKLVAAIPGGNEGEEKLVQDSSEHKWTGSGLGSDWDDRVGAGAAAASIVGRLVFSGWKLVSEEVKHANANYLPAVVAAVLNKRIPYHDDMTLTNWYAHSSQRWRVLSHRLTQATATLLLFDALDIVGRAGEAARLSGVEFSQSFPGIRGSQYKVEGVLLRALQSLRSDERGSKKGQEVKVTNSSQHSGSSSTTTRSQTQSPWKVRRRSSERLSEFSNLNNRQYFFFSPSLQDTNKQEALEVQAMTLEPQSGHYSEPVVVCDFTALYPSLIIAYNLCYSTCAGKLDYHSTRREMQLKGKTRGKVGPMHYPERRTATVLKHHMKSIGDGAFMTNAEDLCESDFVGDRVYIAPTGTIYLSETVLKGVLPQVLDEILTTRAMLKRAAKEYVKGVKNLSPAILRQLEARQLALKYVANVTYGYTSATFSGRCAMPLLADAIVECGRRTLRKAMDIANRWGQGTDPWGRHDNSWLGARVIYGDTDSLFIKMPGRSYREAFEFGEKLCAAVTSLNPPPVQLKLEKVYLGSIMQTMKRYCGMKFESKDQKKPVFEAKGLETIRRDQCALTQKVLRNALITLFKHGIVAVKEYLFRQWSLIFAGQLPVSDFILTGKVRSKYRGGKEGPVQAVLARRLGEADPGRIVRHRERLPYVIVATPGMTFRLKDCVLTPMELLERWDAYKIHSAYYIERHVNAALQRCLGLAPHFVNVADWFQSCPRPRRRTHFWPVKSKRAMITAYFGNDICSLCERKCQADGSNPVVVCNVCREDKVRSIQFAAKRLNEIQDEANALGRECSSCNGCFEDASTFAFVQSPKLASSNFVEQQHIKKKKNDSSLSSLLFGRSSNNNSNHKDTLLLPLANCVCIDCPVTFRRHRVREQGIEAEGTYNALCP